MQDVFFKEKIDKLFWVVRIRYIAPPIIWFVTFVSSLSGFEWRFFFTYSAVLAAFLFFNTLIYFNLKYLKTLSEEKRKKVSLNLTIFIHSLIDIALFTFMVNADGGLESNVFLMYFFVIIVVGFLSNRFYSYLTTAVAAFFYYLLVWLEYLKVVPHVFQRGPEVGYYSRLETVLGDGIFNVFIFFLVLYFIRFLNVRSRHLQDEFRSALSKYEEVRRQYADLFDNANDLIQSVDENGKIIYTNRRWREVLGYKEEEIKDLNFLKILDRKSVNVFKDVISELKTGMNGVRSRVAIRTKKGKKIQLGGNSSARSVEGKFAATRDIFRDVTAQVEIEKEAEKKKKELERFNEITVGREIKMVELKKTIAKLEAEVKNLQRKEEK